MKRSYSHMSSGDRTDKLFTPTKHSPGKSARKQHQYSGLMHASGIFSSPARRDPNGKYMSNTKAEMAKHKERVDKIYAHLDKPEAPINQPTEQTAEADQSTKATDASNDQPIDALISCSSSPSLAASTPLNESDDELIELGCDSPTSPSPRQVTKSSIVQSPYQSILQSPSSVTKSNHKITQTLTGPVRSAAVRRSLFTQFSPLPPVHSTNQSINQSTNQSANLLTHPSARRALFQPPPLKQLQSPHKVIEQSINQSISQSPLKPIRPADADKVRRSLSNRFNLAAESAANSDERSHSQ